jgi:hypothetical protein
MPSRIDFFAILRHEKPSPTNPVGVPIRWPRALVFSRNHVVRKFLEPFWKPAKSSACDMKKAA